MMIKTELVVIVPTRGRPQSIVELANTFAETCTEETRLVAVIDHSDPCKDEYLINHDTVIVGDNNTMVEALNYAAKKIAYDARYPFAVGFMGDDHRPRTLGWDRSYLDVLREAGTGMVYGNDLLQGANIPTQIAMTTNIIRSLGYMAYPRFKHLYVDNYWLELGNHFNFITYLNDVIVEHVHPAAGKAAMDAGYQRVNASAINDHDQQVFTEWLHGFGRTADVKKVEQCMR